MSPSDVFIQQVITGLSNGMIIALIALGYTMVYGIIELINFAHGDLFMLGGFLALTLVGALGLQTVGESGSPIPALLLILGACSVFCAAMNWIIYRVAYQPLLGGSKLAPLVSAIGVSFVLMNIGLFWGGLPMKVFGAGNAAAAPKNFPNLLSNQNLLGADSSLQYTLQDLMVLGITIPLMLGLTLFVQYTKFGKAMRAVAQDAVAARLMGIDVNRVIGATFILGGALAGAASLIYSLYNNTIYFQMGYRAGLDAFTAAVVGGIGRLPGATLGGIAIGLIRAMSDQYIGAQWSNVVVFGLLVFILVFRPTGLLGSTLREKV